MAEGDLHKSVAELLDVALLPPAVWTTFPAGWGRLGKATAGYLRGCGLKAGMPDILCFYDGRCLGIELKAPDGRISNQQATMFGVLEAAGVDVYICDNAEDVLGVLRHEKFPLREVRITA